MKTRFIIFLFLALFAFPSRGQIYNFRQYSLEQGLSQSQVFDICEDVTGNMWFATYGGGISVYDGQQTNYFNTTNGLPSYSVISLLSDSHGNIWIGTAKGIAVYNGSKFIAVDPKNQLSHYWIWDIAEDRDGNIWIGTDLGAWVYKNGKLLQVKESTISSSQIFTIFVDSDNNVWFSTFKGGVVKFDGKKYHHNVIDSTSNMMVEAIYQDRHHDIWIGSENGLYYMNGNEKKRYSVNNGLSDNHIISLNEDVDGNLWIGTANSGLSVFNGSTFTHIGGDQGIESGKIFKIFCDSEHHMWIATDGGGAFIFNGFAFKHIRFPEIPSRVVVTSIEITPEAKYFGTDGNGIIKYLGINNYFLITNSDGLPDNSINKILKAPNNNLWIGTDNGLCLMKGNNLKTYTWKDGLPGNNITTLLFDQEKKLWIGTYGTGVSVYNQKKFRNYNESDGLASNYIWDLLETRTGDIYIATENGLTVYDGKSFKSYYQSDGLPANKIWSLDQDAWGNIWIGSEGISCFNGKKFLNYNTFNGISSNMIFLVRFDSKNNLLIGTEKGLDKLTITKEGRVEKISHYGKKEGFIGVETNTNAAYNDDDGKIWFGTLDGVTLYDPWEDKEFLSDPKVVIKKVTLFYEESNIREFSDSLSPWTKIPLNLKLPYSKNNILFEFIVLDYNIPENVQYCYKLEGLDEDWLPVTYKNTANYTNLPPGNYIFKVKGCNSKGIWSKIPISYSFNVQRPIWLTWWFYLVIVVLVSAFVWVLIFFRTKNLNRKKRLLEIKVEKRTMELRHQKNALEKALKINDEQRKKLERANEEISQNARLKEQFLANTSHEIRTPLNIILGFTNLLLNSPLEQKQFDYIQNIKMAGSNLLVIINDILDFSKIEADKLTIEELDFDFKEFIRSFVSLMSVTATEKNIDIRYHIDKNLPQYIKGDPVRLNQVLTNLVRNSIKFTNENGWIRIEIDLLTDNETQVTIYFQVIDNGIGILPDQIDKIFESFNQASNETTRKFGGTGLGLSIAKKIIDVQGGKIGAYSEIDKGSTFFFQLNFKKGSLPNTKITSLNIDEESSKIEKLNILMVEDNPINATLAIETIKQYNSNIQVDLAENGQIGVNRLLEKMYDIVIMDIQMPEMDGYEATRFIRQRMDEPRCSIPILGMSAHAMKTEKEKCLALGMNDYITKPFNPAELFYKIENLMGKKIIETTHIEFQETKLKNIKLNFIDLSILAKTYRFDESKLLKILQLYLKDVPRQVNELTQQIELMNWKQVKVLAHSLKTSFKYLGINQGHILAKQIELSANDNTNKSIPADMKDIIEEWKKAEEEIKKVTEHLLAG